MPNPHPQEAIPYKKQLKDMGYRFLMVLNNQEGNGKKVARVFKEEGSKWLRPLMCTKEQRKKRFSLIKCIDSRDSLINLLCSWSKTVRGGEIFINHTFGNWKLMMVAAFEGSHMVNAGWQKLEKSDNKEKKLNSSAGLMA